MSDPLKEETTAREEDAKKLIKPLPRDISGALEAEGLHLDIRAFALTDLGLNDDLARGAVILTDDEVWTVELEGAEYTDFGSATAMQSTGFFQRNRNKVNEAARQELLPGKIKHLQKYAIDRISDARLDNEVVGGKLVLTLDGEDYMLMRFSGSLFKEMNLFVQHLKSYLEEKQVLADSGLTEEERAEKVQKLRDARTEAAQEAMKQEEEGRCPSCGRRYPEEGRAFCPHCLPRESVFKRLLQLFSPYKWRVAVLFLMIGLSSVFNAFIPWLSGTFLYDIVLGQDPEWLAGLESLGVPGGAFALLMLLIVMLVITRLLQQVTGVLHGRQTAHMVPGAIANIKRQAFDSLQKLSLGFFMRKQTGSLMQRINGDAEDVTQFFIDGLPYLLFNVITIVATAVIMFQMNWILAILSLFLLPPLFILSVYFIPGIWRAFGKRARTRRSVYSVLNDSLTGARVVRAFGQQSQLNKRFDGSSGRYREAEMNVVDNQIRFNVPYSIAQGVPTILVWTIGALLIIFRPGTLDFGQLVSFTGYLGMLQGPIRFFSMIFIIYSQTMNAAQRMFEIIDARPEIVEIDEPVRTELTGEIEMKDVTFSYEVNKPVLRDINFHVKPGEMLGIVGKSGAGKSTLVNLIGRLYDAEEGQILLDGHDIRNLSFESLHGAVAMVSQETYIFMGTIAENIAYARPDATEEEIVQAAMAAAAHDFISRLPDGYDTHVGTGGRQMSGGERQRVSIARAILADPTILVLDEATASVDTETERQIQDSLDELTKGRTTLSIAHRLSTLRNADRIIVLENGRLTEAGTHEELEEKKGEYHGLMELQKKALAMRVGIVDDGDTKKPVAAAVAADAD